MQSTLLHKLIIVINGKGGSGKDTICDIVSKHHKTRNISTITPIKEVASFGGWQGGKTEKDRKFLSDLKELFSEYNDLPNNYALNEYKSFMKNQCEEVLFVHIREPENINKFIKSIDGNCITLLVTGGKSQNSYGNRSDDEVENYTYDYIYNNTKPLDEVENDFMAFFENIINETERRYLPH